jgi:hypothetical protein
MGRIQIAITDVIFTGWRYADEFMAIGVLKNVDSIVEFFTAIKEPYPGSLIFALWPPVALCAIAVSGRKKEI